MRVFLKKYWEYIAALLTPLVLVLVHCATRQAWFFGDGSILQGDANIQYIYIFEELWNRVHNGDFSFFSWHALGGFDFYLNALYYTISPATIIILLLPKYMLQDALQFFIILKWMLMCFTAVYFFMHTRFNRLKKYKRWVSFVLGFCYVMGNYFLGMLSLFNWLDSLVIFPVLLLLIEKMVEQRKWKCYYVLLAVCMLCNFYIAFPICIFLFMWFVLQLQLSSGDVMKKLCIFIGSSLLAAVTAVGAILPCVLNVNERYILGQSNENMDYITSIRLSVSEWLSRFFLFDTYDVSQLQDTPFYFCIGVILVSMLFVFIRLDKKEKICKLIMMLFIIVSFFVGILNYIWHGCSIPHGIDQRYAFLFYMMICVMALDVIQHLDSINIKHIIVVLSVGVGAFGYAFFNIKELNEFYVYLCTILLIVFYVILMVLCCIKSITISSFVKVMLFVCLIETAANAYVQLQWYSVVAPYEQEHIPDVEPLAECIQLQEGERVAIVDAGYNIGLKQSLPNVSGFVSYSYGNLSNLAAYMGVNIFLDAGAYYTGISPLMNYIFNIRYGIGAWETEFSDVEFIEKNNNLSLYKMQHESSLGYMVKDTATQWIVDGSIPWETQNQYVSNMLGEDMDVFKTFYPEDMVCATMWGNAELISSNKEEGSVVYGYTAAFESDGNIVHFTAPRDMDLYVNVKGNQEIIAYASIDQNKVYHDSDARGQTSIHVGKLKKGQEVSIVCTVEDAVGEQVEVMLSFSEFDEEIFDVVHKKLSANLYEISEIQGDIIKGNIKVDEAGIMMTSIPAMKGFTVFVNGNKCEYKTIANAFIGVPLEEGEYEVEFRYETPYARIAWLISLMGFALFGVLCGVGYYRKKRIIEK